MPFILGLPIENGDCPIRYVSQYQKVNPHLQPTVTEPQPTCRFRRRKRRFRLVKATAAEGGLAEVQVVGDASGEVLGKAMGNTGIAGIANKWP